MGWPQTTEYYEALQNPQCCFQDPELRQGQVFTVDALGLPRPCSGNFADVYGLHCPTTGKRWAVKCFTRKVPGLHERYSALAKPLRRAALPFLVDFQYLEQGICIHGQWFPILKMPWIQGHLLNEFVKEALDKPHVLQQLAELWVRLARELSGAGLAHGDLQHGNVLLVPGNKAGAFNVRLIDYDGMYVPALAHTKSGEVGHPNYQHPQRLREGTYDAQMDRFSHLVIYTALRSLAGGGRALWQRHDNGENLLFRERDFQDPCTSVVLQELWRSQDAAVHSLVGHLVLASQEPLASVPLLEHLVGRAPRSAFEVVVAEQKFGLTAAQEQRVARLLGVTVRSVLEPPQRTPSPPVKTVLEAPQQSLSPPASASPSAGTELWWLGDSHLTTSSTPAGSSATVATTPMVPPQPSRWIVKRAALIVPLLLMLMVLCGGVFYWLIFVPSRNGAANQPGDKLGMKLVLVPKGTFWMGGSGGNPGTKKVEIPYDFYLGAYEVTQGQWQAVMGDNPSYFSRRGDGKDSVRNISDEELKQFPVENVRWTETQAFIKKLNDQENDSGWVYRLPTEAEWEYACRGGPFCPQEESGFDFYLERPSNSLSPKQANFSESNLNRTAKVGSYAPNRLGLYDMHGNVWEWCQDRFEEGGPDRVHRGGCWGSSGQRCRAANRDWFAPSDRLYYLGFRLARVPSRVK